jgi:hypothetical protein
VDSVAGPSAAGDGGKENQSHGQGVPKKMKQTTIDFSRLFGASEAVQGSMAS